MNVKITIPAKKIRRSSTTRQKVTRATDVAKGVVYCSVVYGAALVGLRYLATVLLDD